LNVNVCCDTSSESVVKNSSASESVNGKPLVIAEPPLVSDRLPVPGRPVNIYVKL
jgi:hypothetical protein